MATFSRATTPTLVLELPNDFDFSLIRDFYVTIKQDNKTKITKTAESLDVDEAAKEIGVFLTQAETLPFYKGTANVQLNWMYDDGKRDCSEIATIAVGDNLLPEVLT